MRIFGLTKIKNEEKILRDTLDHWGNICSGGIYVVDDESTDSTVEICKAHPAVKKVEVVNWDPDRERAEWWNRQQALNMAMENAEDDDWFVYFDADERIYFDRWDLFFKEDVKAIACRLYDVYITPKDVKLPYLKRDFVGPEYRTITFFFKNSPYLGYDKPDQRIVNLEPGIKIQVAGIVKHFGKGLSVQHWEETCDYYINFWPKYAAKWRERKGKAVKKDYKSDFGNDLIKFNDVLSGREEGFSLEDQVYGRN